MHLTRESTVLSCRGLRKSYAGTPVLDGLDLDVGPGEVVVLSGENGAGKSTLLECLSGAQPFDAGELRLLGEPSQPRRERYWRTVYSILDDFAWFPDLTVLDHLRLLDPALDAAEAADRLARLGAGALVDRLPLTLSSGQRQRCALATAAVRDWQVLCLDEPERHLDSEAVDLLARFVSELAPGRAILVASHDERLRSMPGARRLRVEAGRLAEVS